MNSSGIKRGLAASAVSALAVAGIPALASSAHAAPGDSITVASVGPVRNAGTTGGVVLLKTKGVDETNLELVASNLTGSGSPTVADATQSVTLLSATRVANGTTGDSDPTDGLDEITARLAVTTPSAGGAFNVAIYEEEGGSAGVDAAEPRAQVSGITSGPIAALEITPASQTAPEGQASAPYTLNLRDSAGRLTQLSGTEDIDFTATGGVAVSDPNGDATTTAAEAPLGSAKFTATGGTTGLQTITAAVGADDAATISGSTTATLDVVTAATLNVGNIDVVTGADSWTGFGDADADATDPDNPVAVRVDQNSIRIDIASDDPADRNASVVLTVNGTDTTPLNAADGNGLTFGGKATATLTTTLDGNGRGSVTITPDAGTIQNLDSFTLSGSGLGTLNFQFQRANVSAVQAPAEVYVSALKGSVDITATVTDQFGLPIAGAQVDAQRTAGANTDLAPQARKTTDAKGQATFTFTDTNATAGQNSTVTFRAYADQFDATPDASDTTTIRYTVDGQGADYTLALDGVNTAGTAYSPNDVTVIPLTDTVANTNTGPKGDEVTTLTIVGGEPGAPVTVTADNGVLILDGSDNDLSDATESATGVVGQSFRLIGTKSGVATVTVASAGRTKTAQFTVQAQGDDSAARNVTVSGPAESAAGSLAVFTAVITDAFGNPVAGIPVFSLNVQVTGPGALQDTEAATDENGMIELNVRLQDDAEGPVTIKVTGLPRQGYQFGADADQLFAGDPAGNAEGLPASANGAEATTIAKGAVTPPEPKPKRYIGLQLRSDATGNKDVLKVNAKPIAEGLVAKVFVNGKKVGQHTLNSAGNHNFSIKDKNGSKITTYVVKVAETAKTHAAKNQEKIK
jgi:hypothetical protein